MEGSALWFGARGFEVLDARDDGVELMVEVETTATVVGCPGCGTRAVSKGRRWVTVRDAPSADRQVIVRWRKRLWRCPDPDCDVATWTERVDELAAPRRVLTARAARWAMARVAAIEGTPASIARAFGIAWSTVWAAVRAAGAAVIDDDERVGQAAMVGFDETVMQPAHRQRRRRFVTAVVDVATSQILDVFEGRDAVDLRRWLTDMPPAWRDALQVISVDPHEGYRSAVVGSGLLGDVTIVVDPFHICRLANMALTRARQRVQRETLEHRGWKGDPLYDVRKLLLMGAERVDEAGWQRIHAALRDGDPDGIVRDTWVAKELVRDVYLAADVTDAERALDAALEWCDHQDSGPELRRLAKTLRRWREQILAHHTTGASNGRAEAANLLIKQVKRSGRGFRNFDNYRLRILLAGGHPRDNQPVTSTRLRPRSVA